MCDKSFACSFYHTCFQEELGGYLYVVVKNCISTCCLSRLLGFCWHSPLIIHWPHTVKYNEGLWGHFNTSILSFIPRAIHGQGACPVPWKDLCGFFSHGNSGQFPKGQQYPVITSAWSWADPLPLPERIILMGCWSHSSVPGLCDNTIQAVSGLGLDCCCSSWGGSQLWPDLCQ